MHISPAVLLVATLLLAAHSSFAADLGLFGDETDVGSPSKAGSVRFDPQDGSYSISGGGENMWATRDAFHFVWKRISGDAVLSSDIEFPKSGGNAHRKACLIIRQTLEADSPYVDAALHGDGLTSLQYREQKGGPTCEIQSIVKAPQKLQITKRGDQFFMSLAMKGQSIRNAGGSIRMTFKEPFYVGLGVCAHDDSAIETARFTSVRLENRPQTLAEKPLVESTLEIVELASKNRRVVHHAPGRFEAPNWSGDGRFFIFNGQGRLWRIPLEGGEPKMIDTGTLDRCNNDHGISPDGKQLAISHHGEAGRSRIYTLPIDGGTPKLVTPLGPSYWHGWSPDGKTLVYCAERQGEFDVYSIPTQGGSETRLTTAKGLDDGPEYTADGRWIYFNSERSGRMQIWRMKPDGSDQQQVTRDEYNNWFPHPSPDGKWIAILSYEPDVSGHPADKNVLLRLLPMNGGEIQTIARIFGGQGTINVPSWSPDSKRLAFVSYLLVNP